MARRGRLLFLGRTFQRLECRGGRCVQILNDEALASVDREPAPDTDGSNHNKKMRMQIYSRPSLLTLPGVVLLAATMVPGIQPGPASASAQLGVTTSEPVNELSGRPLDRSFESFAPTVKKVAPAVVRIAGYHESCPRGAQPGITS